MKDRVAKKEVTMGKNIQTYLEVRIGKAWHLYGWPDFIRNLTLFEKMECIAADTPRGLPHDISPIVRLEAEWWGSLAFHHSWLNEEEVRQLHKYYTSIWHLPDEVDAAWGGWTHLVAHRTKVQDVRLVFWFV